MVEKVRGGGGGKAISLVQKLFRSILKFLHVKKSNGIQNGYFYPKS